MAQTHKEEIANVLTHGLIKITFKAIYGHKYAALSGTFYLLI